MHWKDWRRHHHETAELLLLESIALNVERIVALLSPPFATTAVLSINGGNDMALTVGSTETVTLTFEDADGNAVAPPAGDGTGLVVTISSDDTTVATVGATTASGDTATAEATGVSVGSFNYTATVANASGADLLDDDGTTAFVQPSPLAETVEAAPPAQAVTGVLSVS